MMPSVIVVGGGVIGLSVAWTLSRRGCEVTLIDRGDLTAGGSRQAATSWTAGGILPPASFDAATDPMDRLRGLSHRLYPQWAEDLAAATSIDVGLRRCGGWYLADSPGERASMLGMQSYWDDMSIQCDSVPLQELILREPELSAWAENKPDATAWWVPDEFQVRPPRLLAALTKACQDGGVRLVSGVTVTDVQSQSSEAVVRSGKQEVRSDEQEVRSDEQEVRSGEQEWNADFAVVGSGAWSGAVASRLQLDQALVPIRGQMLLLKTDRPIVSSVINVGNRYIIAREDGHTLVGSCEEEVGFDTSTDPNMIAQLQSFLAEIIPELGSLQPLRTWSGLRPMTFDGFPIIGSVPGQKRLFVAAGHYRSGIHLAPATAEILADAILGETPPIDLSAFRVGKQQSSSF